MPLIKLKGELHIELLNIGLKPGDEVDATTDPISKVGTMHFDKWVGSRCYECSVWPDNYDIINPKS